MRSDPQPPARASFPTSLTPREALAHQAALDRAAASCAEAADLIGATANRAAEGDQLAAQDFAYRATCAAMDALNTLSAAGAACPLGTDGGAVSGNTVCFSSGVNPLTELSTLATPAARDLLAALERAQELAETVDAERGRTVGEGVPLLPGESRGTDLAETISELCLRLRREVYGASRSAGRE